MKKNIDNNEKKDKKNRKRTLKQVATTAVMVGVSVFVISVATYAWFLITNTPKIVSSEFKADTVGNLKISNVKDDKPEEYKDSINMFESGDGFYLSPVTTADGVAFVRPVYGTDGKVTGVESIENNSERTTKYIYEKRFFLRAGEANANTGKKYDIYLTAKDDSNTDNYGTWMKDSDKKADGTAANSLRISFQFDKYEGYTVVTGEDNEPDNTTKIYEPNCDVHNSDAKDGTNMDVWTDSTNKYDGKYGGLTIMHQGASQIFGTLTTVDGKETFTAQTTNTERSNTVLCRIEEGKDVEIVLRMWIEGTDVDCANMIAADTMKGQIQFVSKEVKN